MSFECNQKRRATSAAFFVAHGRAARSLTAMSDATQPIRRQAIPCWG
jgi:hypothetical protein